MTDWYSMNDMCATCGRPFGDHLGTYCFGNGLDEFVLLTKPTPSLGALLRQALERNKQAPTDPNAAMIARDGKAKSAKHEGWDGIKREESTAKPPIAGLTLSPDLRDSSHQVSPGFGSAFLLR